MKVIIWLDQAFQFHESWRGLYKFYFIFLVVTLWNILPSHSTNLYAVGFSNPFVTLVSCSGSTVLIDVQESPDASSVFSFLWLHPRQIPHFSRLRKFPRWRATGGGASIRTRPERHHSRLGHYRLGSGTMEGQQPSVPEKEAFTLLSWIMVHNPHRHCVEGRQACLSFGARGISH